MLKRFVCLLMSCISALILTCAVNAAESLSIVPVEMNDKLVNLLAGQDTPVPSGMTRFIGNLADPSFSIPSINNITVKDSSGKILPLRIEESSLVEEFGGIVSLWLSFDVPDEQFSKDNSLTIEWGKDVESTNTKVKNIKLDPASAKSYRTFTWRKKDTSASFARIEVIADSNADYYFLWYLLPMAIIFIVLTVRKLSIGKIPEVEK